jgi:hypothetical protein
MGGLAQHLQLQVLPFNTLAVVVEVLLQQKQRERLLMVGVTALLSQVTDLPVQQTQVAAVAAVQLVGMEAAVLWLLLIQTHIQHQQLLAVD